MAVSTTWPEAAMACCKSVVKVAIPQRRGRELPMKAIRRVGVKLEPPRTPRLTTSQTVPQSVGVLRAPAHLTAPIRYISRCPGTQTQRPLQIQTVQHGNSRADHR